MPIEELIRFRSDLKSNPHLRAQAACIAPEPHGVISLVAATGSVVEFANQLGYNFSEVEVQQLLDKLTLVEEMAR